MKTLHVYGPRLWHDEAYLIGTLPALRQLGEVLNLVLAGAPPGAAAGEFMVADGEGYGLHIIAASQKTLDSLVLPYRDKVAQGDTERAIWPETLSEVRMQECALLAAQQHLRAGNDEATAKRAMAEETQTDEFKVVARHQCAEMLEMLRKNPRKVPHFLGLVGGVWYTIEILPALTYTTFALNFCPYCGEKLHGGTETDAGHNA